MNIRRALYAMACGLMTSAIVAGCSNLDDNFDQIDRLLFPNRQQVNSRALALSQAGAAQLQVSFLKLERAGTMLREGERAGLTTWLSADGATLITEDGMLRGMRGFGGGMMASDISQSLERVLRGQDGPSERFHSFLKGDDQIETRTYHCTVSTRGDRTIKVGGRPLDTRLMAEECNSTTQEFLNLYWVSRADNQIVQSRQWAGDFLGIVTTRVVPK